MAKSSVYLIPEKKMNRTVSHLKGVRKAVRNEGEDIATIANARLAPHRRTGAAHIEVEQSDVDTVVSLVDEAALSIEFGHYMGSSSLGTSRTFIPGLHLFIDWYHDGLV